MKQKSKREYVARLVVYGLTKEVKPETLAKWLRKEAENLEKRPNEYSHSVFTARLMK